MNHLLLTLVFSASLTAFSQDRPMTLMPTYEPKAIIIHPDGTFSLQYPEPKGEVITPDTLRALILATMCKRCAAEAIPGFVVIAPGKRPVYLDCRKRALKWPQVGWRYELVNPNYKK